MARVGSVDGLLAPGDPPPYEAAGLALAGRALLVCDHAGRRFPASLDRLGLPIEATWRHVAWDVGAAALTRALSVRLATPALLATYSRLVVDCNRAPDHPTAFTTAGDGHRIPGNENVTPAAREARLAAIHRPYHHYLGGLLDRLGSYGPAALVSVHSFTPVMAGRARPWVAGVLWDEDGRIAEPLLATLRALQAGRIGDNEPYSGRFPADYTVHRHGSARGIPHVSIEVRQDELVTPVGVHRWANRLALALAPLFVDLGVMA